DFRRLLEAEGIQVVLDVQSNIQVPGQAIQLQRLLDNLLSNARKFTSDWIHIQLETQADQASLSISDNGPGIPADQVDRIWEKFYQIAQDRNKNHGQGIGLGLSLVREIVHQHHGQIQVQSQPNQGSRFTVTLPLVKRTP
ncbi:ATP-binding protein, partial [Streptococcus danieliae]|nr:ATP-binding protein [Streptococcus danieliae]